MNVIYLDQNFAITFAEKSESNPKYAEAREAVLSAVASGTAVFPYSELHLIESAAMDLDGRTRVAELWDTVSGGFRFCQQKHIRSSQFKDLLLGKSIRLKPHLVTYREETTFGYWIYSHEPESARQRSEQLRAVVERWSRLKRDEIDGKISREEANTLPKLVLQLLSRMLRHEMPSLGELQSEYVDISSELSWTLRDLGHGDDTLGEAVKFMQQHALEVPAIAIECTGLEVLAERYAIDNPQPSAVRKSQLDHDSYDLEALSNYVPYCTAGTTDAKASGIIQAAYRKLKTEPPAIFTLRQIEAFTTFVRNLPSVTTLDPASEAMRDGVQCLILTRAKPEKLISRESFPSENGIEREMLPTGGLKVLSRVKVAWASLLRALQRLEDELEDAPGGDGVLYGFMCADDTADLRFKVDIPFGMFELAQEDIERSIKSRDEG
ncbi:MAG TPA: hypothetical protein VM940_00295 [Chthoniobacterales bacterium]|jgi:hypothetical protein|nr:hypothetical protein [Chthoniobacterales bacterium]